LETTLSGIGTLHFVRFAAASIVVALGACSLLAQTVRDSAGIRIVENRQPSAGPEGGRRLAPAPALVIGTRTGEMYELSGVAGAARLSGGTIVVADGGSRQLRFFDSTGAFIRAVGGPGDGPGEFRELLTFARDSPVGLACAE
jgi:hypothetical protein